MRLSDIFKDYKKIGIAVSGGADSAYLLSEASRSDAAVFAYVIRSVFQPEREIMRAVRVAEKCGVPLRIIDYDVLSVSGISENRCYRCKQGLLGLITACASNDGCEVVFDGTNASDDAGDRPGMKALAEAGVRSPLRECGITKDYIRAHVDPEFNVPSYSCLATRIRGEITLEKIRKVDEAETYLESMGFEDFRARFDGTTASLELTARDRPRFDTVRARLETIFDEVILSEVIRGH